MFTGIIETTGKLIETWESGTNRHFRIQSNISNALKIDQSVAHNGVCLTVVACNAAFHEVVAVKETLTKTNLGQLKTDDLINLERCLVFNGRLDGHLVQGHVDGVAKCSQIKDENGSYLISFEILNPPSVPLIIEKGSITVNGVSLTAFNILPNQFQVAIIPYTWQHTNFQQLALNDMVNIEYDIIGKYLYQFSKSYQSL